MKNVKHVHWIVSVSFIKYLSCVIYKKLISYWDIKYDIMELKITLTLIIINYFTEFVFRVPIRSVVDAKSMESENKFYALSQEEIEEFRTSHD